jgi:hypothetical protein
MNNDIFDKETTQLYLLGLLPGPQTLQYDELSVVDDDFNHFLRNVENDLVDSYINGSMDASTLKNFESFYLASPKRMERVAFARTLYRLADRDPTSRLLTRESLAPAVPGFWDKLRFVLNPARLSVAAVVLVCLIGAAWFALTSRPGPGNSGLSKNEPANLSSAANGVIATELFPPTEPPSHAEIATPANNLRVEKRPAIRKEALNTPTPEQRTAPVVATFVLSPPLRGSQPKNITVASNVERIVFRLELEPSEFSAYRLELRDQSNKVLWSSGKMRSTGSDSRKSLTATVPANLLQARNYVFSVSGIPASGEPEIIGDYPFSVVR